VIVTDAVLEESRMKETTCTLSRSMPDAAAAVALVFIITWYIFSVGQ
jgi:hypothetical protein